MKKQVLLSILALVLVFVGCGNPAGGGGGGGGGGSGSVPGSGGGTISVPARSISNMEIISQPTRLEYIHGDTLDLTGLEVMLTYKDDGSTENVVHTDFAAKNITISHAHGHSLNHSTHQGHEITIKCGSFTVSIDPLTVHPPKVTTFVIDPITAQTYTGSAIRPGVTVKDSGTILHLNTHYTAAYTNNIDAGTATITITGIRNYEGNTGSTTFSINPKAITFAVDTILPQTYTGSQIRPTVTVRDGTTVLALNTHYTVAYGTNTDAGTTGTVTITGTGNYAGSTGSGSFVINQYAVAFSNLTADGNASSTTTQLTLTFDKDISLTAADITFNAGTTGAVQGALTGSGRTYVLTITGITSTGTVIVGVSKTNYTINPASQPVTVYQYTAPGPVPFTITFTQIADNAPSITGPVLYRVSNGGPTTATLTVSDPTQYDSNSISWRVQDTSETGTGASFTLSAANAAYNYIGPHFVTVSVKKGGVPYNKTVSFRVEY